MSPSPIPPVERTISGKGIIIVPSEYIRAKVVYLYTAVRRRPASEYLNVRWSPSKRYYGNLNFCIDDYVVSSFELNFDYQRFLVHSSQSSQNLLSLICALDATLDSFESFAIALGLPYVRRDPIKEHPYLAFQVNNIKFNLYSSSAVDLYLQGLPLDMCEDDDGDPQPPPPPPPLPAIQPPDLPVVVSPPYDGDSDGGFTEPFPGDVTDPPTPGVCRVVYDYRDLLNSDNNADNQLSATFPVVLPAEILQIRYFDNDSASNPPGTPRSSDAIVRGGDGSEQEVPLIRNGVNGHIIARAVLQCD